MLMGLRGLKERPRAPKGLLLAVAPRGVQNHIWALESTFVEISCQKLVFNHLTFQRVTD